MSQKIKKQIKRSMPYFLIFSLAIGSMVVGLVFNFNTSIYSSDNLFAPVVQADTATTSVQVLNAPPAFTATGYPEETFKGIGSTSTSPVNVGENISFAATASDPEPNSYYLIICPTDGTASTSGAVPECPSGSGDEFCVSSLTGSGAQASCTYTGVADPGAETDDWYAFVCDNHATQADCSASSQGQSPNDYATSSPMYINHGPTFTAVITSDDNKDPGGTWTFRATTSDPDITGEPDGVYLSICSTNSFSTTTGCGGSTWCTGSATSSSYIECSFASSTAPLNWVAPDGTYSYWAFVMDNHSFATTSNPQTNTYTVNNVAPTISGSAVYVNDSNNITLSIKNASEVEVIASGTIADLNGCGDIQSATATIYWSGLGTSTAYNCAGDDDNCYPITSSSCTYSGGCGDYPDDTGWYTCTTTMAFHAIPTNVGDGNPEAYSYWMGGLTGFDDQSAYGTATTVAGNAVDVIGGAAIEVQETQIQYGQIAGGQNSGDVNSTTTVENYGNTPINTDMAPVGDMIKTDLTDWINANQQEFGTSTFSYGSGTYSAASTTNTIVFTETSKPTTAAQTITDEIYWGIAIPGGTTSGTYEGTNYFVVAVDSNDW